MNVYKRLKERSVDQEQIAFVYLHDGQRRKVVAQVEQHGFDEHRHKAQHVKRDEYFELKDRLESVPRNDQKPAPFGSQLAGVRLVSLFINRHSRSPLPSGKYLRASRACSSNDEAAPATPPPAGTDRALQRIPAKRS